MIFYKLSTAAIAYLFATATVASTKASGSFGM